MNLFFPCVHEEPSNSDAPEQEMLFHWLLLPKWSFQKRKRMWLLWICSNNFTFQGKASRRSHHGSELHSQRPCKHMKQPSIKPYPLSASPWDMLTPTWIIGPPVAMAMHTQNRWAKHSRHVLFTNIHYLMCLITSRDIDVEDIFCYELAPTFGDMRITKTKSVLKRNCMSSLW